MSFYFVADYPKNVFHESTIFSSQTTLVSFTKTTQLSTRAAYIFSYCFQKERSPTVHVSDVFTRILSPSNNKNGNSI